MPTARPYIDIKTIAGWFDVKQNTVHVWLNRHSDFPPPDITLSGVHGWLPAREDEIREWHASRRGQAWRREVNDSRDS